MVATRRCALHRVRSFVSPSLWIAALAAVSACGDPRSAASTTSSQSGDALATQCSKCHGSDENAAPPRSVQGATDTASVAVGAHQAHLRGGSTSGPVACAECHVVPARWDAQHGTQAHGVVRFGPLATRAGAAPRWDRDAARCSGTYCHGASLPGGSNTAPQWTKVDGTQAACGTCHGVPPPAPHIPNTNCGNCHAGYSSSAVNLATHVNGTVEVNGLSCTSCHGDPANGNAAPPVDTQGDTVTTAPGVGAHQTHLHDGALRAAVACADCHAVPTSPAHANGTVDLTFSALASTGGLAPAFDAASATCASTYCHGASLPGGTNTTPRWTKVDGTQAACGTCHGIPPDPSTGHPYASAATDACARCHPATVKADGGIDVAGGRHVNGSVEFDLSCTSCHGDPSRQPAAIAAAPPSGSRGETDPAALAVGAHLSHLQDSTIRLAVACSECHVVPTSTLHANGTADVAFGPLARTGGANPNWDPSAATCSSTYCHGATLNAGGSNQLPQWTRVDSTQAACGTCHGVPPPGHPHSPDQSLTDCSMCHPATMNKDGTINVAGGKHIDGVVQAD